MKRKWIALFAASVLAFSAFAGCKDDGGTGNSGNNSGSQSTEQEGSFDENLEISVKLDKNTYEAVEDEIFTLTATVTPAGYVRWKSSDTKIATVSTGGRVIAKRPGTVTITASVEGATDSCVVTVKAAENAQTEYVSVENEVYFLSMEEPNEKQTVSARYVKLEGDEEIAVSGKTFTYESINEEIAIVSESGEITPVGEGTTEIVVSCDGINGYVTADVYTAGISTPEEWYKMFKNDEAFSERYYLKNDIDFSGYVYDLGRDNTRFGGEVNGNFHTVKNIVQWKDKETNNPGRDVYQAVFGETTIGMRLSNISLQNIRFTKSKCAVISQTYRMHTDDNKQHEAMVSNVFVDAIYEQGGSGLFEIVMGGSVDNVFMRMRKTDRMDFDDSFYGVTERDYLDWMLGSSLFSNVVIYSENGEVKWNKNPSSVGITYLNAYMCTTQQNAAYRAYTTLDTSVWEVSATELPVLKG